MLSSSISEEEFSLSNVVQAIVGGLMGEGWGFGRVFSTLSEEDYMKGEGDGLCDSKYSKKRSFTRISLQ
jgi:hypothetical protein